MPEQLKPCPFCHSEDVETYNIYEGKTFILCNACSALVYFRCIEATEEALAMWNNRDGDRNQKGER